MADNDSPPGPGDLAGRLAEVFDVVGPLYRRAQRKVEQDAPMHGLSVGVRAVLNLLREHGPMTVPQMGRAQALSRQFVQRMVNDAAARGLVETVPNPAHKRSSLIRMTGEGAAAITALIGHERALLRQAAGDLTDADITACLRVLTRLLDFLGDVSVEVDRPADGAWLKLGAEPGLCADCRHPKLNETRRGTVYLRCTRAEWDARLPRYPRLPVAQCPGFERR